MNVLDKKYIESLKKINIREIAETIYGKARCTKEVEDYQMTAYVMAYILYMCDANFDKYSSSRSKEDFLERFDAPENIKEIINRHLSPDWNSFIALSQQYTKDDFLAYLLFYNGPFHRSHGYYSTPESILRLACAILDIKENDKVLDLCSGTGTLLVEATRKSSGFHYTGVELNYMYKEVAELRASILGEDAKLEICDALEYVGPEKVNKIFSNYPFGTRLIGKSNIISELSETLGIPYDTLARSSADWAYFAAIANRTSVNNKAVIIMPSSTAFNLRDKHIREFFVQKGFIEAVITLPARMFQEFGISTSLFVLSSGNESVKLVDASNIGTHRRGLASFSDEDVERILSELENGGDKVVIKTISELAENDYFLGAYRYLESPVTIENGMKLSQVAEISRGAALGRSAMEELASKEPTPYRYLTSANICDGTLSLEEGQYLKELPRKMEKYSVRNNDIVLLRTASSDFKSAVVKLEEGTEAIITGNLYLIRANEEKLDPFFLQAFFSSETGTKLFSSICVGSTLPIISLDNLKNMEVPVPPLDEQKEIGLVYAAAMDEAVLLKRKLAQSLEKMAHAYNR